MHISAAAVNLQYWWMALSIISTAVYFVLTSAFMRRNSQVSIHYVVAVTHGLAALVLLAFVNKPLTLSAMPDQFWKNLLLVALLTWIAKIFYFYAYSRTTVANVTVFSALTPLYAVLLGPMMGFPLNIQQILGIVVITISIFIFFVRNSISHITIVQHGKVNLTIPSYAVVCAFLSTIPTAASTYFQKDAILLSSPICVSFFICAFSAAASFCYFLLKSHPGAIKATNKIGCLALSPLIIIALLQATATLAFSVFIAHGHPAVGQALQRLSSLLQILLAHVFLHQRLNTAWHMLCMGFSIFGFYVLYSA